MPNVYVLAHKRRRYGYFPFGNCAYTDRKLAELAVDDNHEIMEVELPFVGKHVCFVDIDYGWRNKVYNHKYGNDIYPCLQHAKEDPLWRKAMEDFSWRGASRFVHIFTAYNSYDVRPSNYRLGDFCARIHRIRVIKQTYEQYRSELYKFLKKCGY